MGPNGAGKTTTVRILAGLLKPTSGYVRVLDFDPVTQANEIRKNIGFLTENHGNYENLTVEENLDFFGGFYIKEEGQLHDRITEVLKELDITDRRKMKAGTLSKGLKQRLAIAHVLIHDPTIVFFDEPTSGLDPIATVEVRKLILSLKKADRTIFINSHNLEEVQKVCDRVAIIDSGKFKRIGTAQDLGQELFQTQIIHCNLKQEPPEKLN